MYNNMINFIRIKMFKYIYIIVGFLTLLNLHASSSDALEAFQSKDYETAFKLALRFMRDETSGNEYSIRIGNNTVNRQAVYLISQNMNAWELAKVLLNNGSPEDCGHGCPPGRFLPALLPGGELKPSEYEWVETYEDCVKAKGQLSSEQYSQRTGNPRKCVTPDGREFTQGEEGWKQSVGG